MNHRKVNLSERTSQALEKILSKIETDLSWGSSVTWSGSDFEKLSDLIIETTGHSLSVSTLKRIWGRTSQSVQPSVTTLNILAEYLGENSWRAFDSYEEARTDKNNPWRVGERNLYKRLTTIGLVVVGLFMLFSIYKFTPKDQLNSDGLDISKDIEFNLKKVSVGLPNTVVFKYNVGKLLFDTLELQQTWDNSKRIILDRNDSIVTTTYHSPGYYNAKLVADGEIIKNQNLYLPSDGLSAFVNTRSGARNFLSDEFWTIDKGRFDFDKDLFEVESGTELTSLMLVNLLPKPLISKEKFEANISIKIPPVSNDNPCSFFSVLVTGSDDVYMFNLGIKGCSGEFSVYLGGVNISGQNADLSPLGIEADKEASFHLRKEGLRLWAGVDNEEILLSEKCPNIGPVGGIRMFFGEDFEVSKMEISDEERVIDLFK